MMFHVTSNECALDLGPVRSSSASRDDETHVRILTLIIGIAAKCVSVEENERVKAEVRRPRSRRATAGWGLSCSASLEGGRKQGG
jgi:hypothetical protein